MNGSSLRTGLSAKTEPIEVESVNTILSQNTHYEPTLSIGTVSELRFFMENHVYAVWDFMSLLKYLQNEVAPAKIPWTPPRFPEAARLINQIVIDEETDTIATAGHPSAAPRSHFEHYIMAMEEIGADVEPIRLFIELVRARGVDHAISRGNVPIAAKRFMQFTFSVIAWDEPHLVAAAFCVGREELLPRHFEELLQETGVREADAPAFHSYLRRHMDLDGNDHGPAAQRLMTALCGDDPTKVAGARKIARDSVRARQNLLQDIRIGLSSLPPTRGAGKKLSSPVSG